MDYHPTEKFLMQRWREGFPAIRSGGPRYPPGTIRKTFLKWKDDHMAKKKQNVTDQLIKAIREAEKQGVTRYRIAQISGVSEALLCRLVKGNYHIQLETAEKISDALEFRIIMIPKENT
jgi:DNA-binding XRE family transcriptional regulator